VPFRWASWCSDVDRLFRNATQGVPYSTLGARRRCRVGRVREAHACRARVVANAQGDSARFKQVLVEYQKAPAVTRDRLYLDMMQTVLGSASKVLVDQKNGSLLYLPLDKLIQQSSPPASITTPESTAVPPRPATPDASLTLDPSRSRDALRNRDSR